MSKPRVGTLPAGQQSVPPRERHGWQSEHTLASVREESAQPPHLSHLRWNRTAPHSICCSNQGSGSNRRLRGEVVLSRGMLFQVPAASGRGHRGERDQLLQVREHTEVLCARRVGSASAYEVSVPC